MICAETTCSLNREVGAVDPPARVGVVGRDTSRGLQAENVSREVVPSMPQRTSESSAELRGNDSCLTNRELREVVPSMLQRTSESSAEMRGDDSCLTNRELREVVPSMIQRTSESSAEIRGDDSCLTNRAR